ncbi:MAG: T9SS type A sorting domain-containing protein, partial [Bacteroidetes bacterium]|nr:T9SS type A sorting domain-containing protein [Bacteroidota bacterium]
LYSSSSTLPDTLPNPQAILGSTTTFLVTVSDGSCDGSDFVTVVIDNSVTVTATATPDTMTTCGIDTSWLLAVITGSPLTPDPLACGTNGTSLTGLTIDSGAVGTDVTTTAAYGPYQAILMVDERIQYLYRASDLTAISMLDGTITRVGWNVDAKLSTYDFTGFTISMGCTSASTLSNSAWETTTVVYGPASVSTTASAWNMYTLDNPYDWDGSSNVVVEVCWDRSTYACANPVGICGDQIVYTDVGGSNSYSMKREAGGFPTISDSTGCSMVSTGASVSSYRPNTRFVFYNASNVGAWVFAWTPTATVDIPSDSSTFAIPTVETTYTVDVTGGLCAVRDSVTVYCPLPIKLVKFDGKNIGDVIALNWVTLTEINNDYFDILRSRDGEIFTKIGVIKANGNSTTRKDYEFLDGDPYIGINYYKLEQVDYNKSVESSNIIAIEYLPAVVTISNVYPNPADDAINYVVVLPVDGKIHVDVVDPYGRTILTDKLNLSRGQHVLTMDLENISEGLYFLRVRDEKNSDSGYQKFIKK